MHKRIVFIVLDGLGDEYIPQLKGTPLEYVSKELININKLVSRGLCGLLAPVSVGIPPSSDTAHLSMFGYDLAVEYPGRGVFEAYGEGLELKEGEVAFRFNLETVEKKGNHLIIRDRRAGRIEDPIAEKLIEDFKRVLKEHDLPVEIHHTVEHRGTLILKPRDGKLSPKISDMDPHEVGQPVLQSEPYEETPENELENAKRTADLINRIVRLSYEFLNDHELNKQRIAEGKPPGNIIVPRGAGMKTKLRSFSEKWGVKAAFVAGGPLYKGVARLIGMHEIPVPGATGKVKTNLKGKVEGVLKALDEGYDFVFLHIKGTDTLSHDKKSLEKAQFIKKIDEHLEPLTELKDIVIGLTGDHSTSSLQGKHIGLPVPILFYTDIGGRPSGAKAFSEHNCAKYNNIGVIRGPDVMPLLMDLAGRMNEFGLRPSPKRVLYIGAFGRPLSL